MKILITGAAGFIGFHVAMRLLQEGHAVVGIDNINHYYDPALKYGRLALLGVGGLEEGKAERSTLFENFHFFKGDITDVGFLTALFESEKIDVVIHLAAQAGVRYSLVNPDAYVQSNIIGFYNMLEQCRMHPVKHLIYASSSSVYGNSTRIPFLETDMTDDTVSLYAATKKSNELFAYNYSHLFKIPTTGLRFFTVYGPWGRPDMAYYMFADKIRKGEEISLFNGGDMYRDFTYIDDIVEGISRLIDKGPDHSGGLVPKRILNIGNANPVYMKDFIAILESKLGKKAIIRNLPMEETDVYKTYANIDQFQTLTGYTPQVKIDAGLESFIDWYYSIEK